MAEQLFLTIEGEPPQKAPERPSQDILPEEGSGSAFPGVDTVSPLTAPREPLTPPPPKGGFDRALQIIDEFFPGAAKRAPGRTKFSPLTAEKAGKTSEGRDIFVNEDGSRSSERSVTMEVDGKHFNFPTMFGGKELSPNESLDKIIANDFFDPETGRKIVGFDTAEEAESAARNRSDNIKPGLSLTPEDQIKSPLSLTPESQIKPVSQRQAPPKTRPAIAVGGDTLGRPSIDVGLVDPAIVADVDRTAEKFGIPKELFRAQVERESRFRPGAIGKVGERGLVQIRKNTFNEVFQKANKKGNFDNPADTLEGGARYFKRQHQRALDRGYKGEEAWKMAALAYNGGPTQVSRAITKAKQENNTAKPTFEQVAKHVDKRAVAYANDIGPRAGAEEEIAAEQEPGFFEQAGNLISDSVDDVMSRLQAQFFPEVDQAEFEKQTAPLRAQLEEKKRQSGQASIAETLKPVGEAAVQARDFLDRVIERGTVRREKALRKNREEFEGRPLTDEEHDAIANFEPERQPGALEDVPANIPGGGFPSLKDLFTTLQATAGAAEVIIEDFLIRFPIEGTAGVINGLIEYFRTGDEEDFVRGFKASQGTLPLPQSESGDAVRRAIGELAERGGAFIDDLTEEAFANVGGVENNPEEAAVFNVGLKSLALLGPLKNVGKLGGKLAEPSAEIQRSGKGEAGLPLSENATRIDKLLNVAENTTNPLEVEAFIGIAKKEMSRGGLSKLEESNLTTRIKTLESVVAARPAEPTPTQEPVERPPAEPREPPPPAPIEDLPPPQVPIQTEAPVAPPVEPVAPVAPPIAPKPTPEPVEAIPGVEGQKTQLRTVTQDLPVTYKLVEARDLQTSHDPESFAPNPNYPKGVQERQYDTDKLAQARVIDQTQKFDPDFVFTDDPTPTHGPPVVTKEGTVLGGNSRAMTIKRAQKEGGEAAQAYNRALSAALQKFGIDPNEIANFENPVLVRELDFAPTTTSELSALGSDLNRQFTAGLSSFEGAVSSGKRISQETLDFIGDELVKMGDKASIRKLLEQRPTEMLNRLEADGALTQRELPGLFDQKRGLLTNAGKDFIERALLGREIDEPAILENLPAGIRGKIAGALPSLGRIRARGGDFDIAGELKDAAAAVIDAKRRNLTSDQYLAQTDMFDSSALSPRAEALFKALMNDNPNIFKEKLRRFAGAAAKSIEGQTSFVPEQTADESFNQVFDQESPTADALPETPGPSPASRKAANDPVEGSGNAPEDLASLKGYEKMPYEAAKGEEVIRKQIDPTTKKTTSKDKILNMVEDFLGVTIRGKVTNAMTNISGWRERHSGLIRLRKGRFGPVETLVHETGHSIDSEIEATWPQNTHKGITNAKDSWKHKAIPEPIRKKATDELRKLDYDFPEKQRLTEGFAEFLRHYVTTGRAKEIAPTYFKWFESEFLPRMRINDKGRMKLLQPGEKTPKGFKPFEPGFQKLRKEIKVWYDQGAENRLKSQIDLTGELGENPETVPRKAYKFVMKEFLDTNFIFEEVTQKVEDITGETIPPESSPFELATFYKGKILGIAETMIRKDMIDPFGRPVGPSLVDALKPANLVTPELFEDWITFAVALRAKNNFNRGLETGFDLVDLNAVIDKYIGREGWFQAAENVTVWSDQLLDWYVWSGDISPAMKQLYRDLNPIYLPFQRLFREKINITKGGGGGGFEKKGQAIKRTKGSTRPIMNPINAFIESAAAVVGRSTKTKIASTIADMAQKAGVGGLITEIPSASHVKQFTVEKIQDQLKKMGADLREVDPEELINLWYRDSNFYGKDNVVALWRNGELKLYELHPELYQALKDTDIKLIEGLKFFAPFARMLRLGATGLSHEFSLYTNPVRDFVWSALTTKRKWASPLSPLRGALKEFTAPKGSITNRALNNGLQMSTMMGFDRAATQMMYDEIVRSQLGRKGRVLNAINHPVDTLRQAFQFFEMAPRIVELETYNQIQEEHPDWSPESVFIRAFNNAQDVTVNFTKGGRTGRQINEITAFFNASLQGTNKLYRALKENPVRTMWRGFLWATLPALLLWWQNKDKEWWKNLRPEWKYMNMWYEKDNGEVVRAPGSHELFLIFGGIPTAFLDQEYNKDPDAVSNLMKAMIQVLVPPIIPNAVAPFIEVGTNSNWLGNEIEPEWMYDPKTGLPIQERKFFFTPELSVEVSKALRELGFEQSPIQLDHVLRQLSGGLYQRGLGIMDTEKTEKHPLFPRAFLRFPNRPTRQLDAFYGRQTQLQQLKNAKKATRREVGELKRLNLFNRKRIQPIQRRLRKLQKKNTLESMAEINTVYGILAKRLNKFFDPSNKGRFPFAGENGRKPPRFSSQSGNLFLQEE